MQVGEKYLFGDAYKNYSYEQRRAMYENELNMTMYGTCGNMNDPHLDGPVKGSTASEQAVYNRKMVNTQISTILSNAGLDVSLLGNMTFSIEPFNHTLSVFGLDEKGRNALDVYKKALETTDSIPAQFKGAAYDVFSGNLKALMGKDFASIPDMNLEIGFSNGELQDSVFNPDIMRR